MKIPKQIKPNQPLRDARKKLKFWIKILLETNLMNDHNDRKEVSQALQTIKDYANKA